MLIFNADNSKDMPVLIKPTNLTRFYLWKINLRSHGLKKNIWVSLYILRIVEYTALSLYKHLSLNQIKHSSFAKLFLALPIIGRKYHTSITCTYRHT